MSRKTKKQKALNAWNRVFENLIKHKDLERFNHSYEVTRKLYGECEGYLWYNIRYNVFHNIIIPEWLKSTHIEHRNKIYQFVENTLGHGLANELQLIDNKRTW